MDIDKKENMKQYRRARKAFNEVAITPLHIKAGTKQLKESTIKQYVDIITRLHRKNFSTQKNEDIEDVLTHIFSPGPPRPRRRGSRPAR